MGVYHIHSYSQGKGYSPINEDNHDELWAAEQCRETISALERAYLAPPMQMARELKTADEILKNMLSIMAEWQKNPIAKHTKQLPVILERIKEVRALIAQETLPFSGVHRRTIEQASDQLKSILMDGLY
jgi:hypothetical protein